MSHPLLPFITEEIWHNLAPFAGIKIDESSTIMLQPYPEINYKKIDESALSDIEWLKKVILGVRNIRGEMNISPGKPLKVFFAQGDNKDRLRIEENSQFLSKLANLPFFKFVMDFLGSFEHHAPTIFVKASVPIPDLGKAA